MLLLPILERAGFSSKGQAGLGLSWLEVWSSSLSLSLLLAIYVIAVATLAWFRSAQEIYCVRLHNHFTRRLRDDSCKRLSEAEWPFIQQNKLGDLLHVFNMEMPRVGVATQQFLGLLNALVLVGVYVAGALTLSFQLTGLALVCGAGLLVVLRRRTLSSVQLGRGMFETHQKLSHYTLEQLGGFKTVKSYVAEKRLVTGFEQLTQQIEVEQVRAAKVSARSRAVFLTSGALLFASIFWVGVEVWQVPSSSLVVLLIVFARVFPRISSLQQSFHLLLNFLPAYEAVERLMLQSANAKEASSGASETRLGVRERIEIQGLGHSYHADAQSLPVLSDVNMSLYANRLNAIVGPSGSGKSTLADILAGLVRPMAGRLLVDGAELNASDLRSWRRSVGYVTQEPFLFNDTLRANLLWGAPDSTEAEIDEALRLAAAREFVGGLSEGLETRIGDRGLQLSGGERQRIALARVLLRKPSLLLLDEATSALDRGHESQIQRAIELLQGRLTLVVITHRLASIRHADHIIVLRRGRVMESGRWSDLCLSEQEIALDQRGTKERDNTPDQRV